MPTAPPRLARYELRARLGKPAAWARCFLAYDTRVVEREVALKLLVASHLLADPQWLPRFRSEARAAGSA